MNEPSQPSNTPNLPVRIRIALALLLALLAGGAIVYWAFFQREYSEWTEVVQLWDGPRLKLQQLSSQRAYHGIVAHNSPFWWGGGDPWHVTGFKWKGREYRWQGPYIPIAVQPDQDRTVYIVVYDRESEEARHTLGTMFRIYRSTDTGSWDEIDPKEFPKHLAIQNTWLHEYQGCASEYELVAKMDPGEPWFRRSLTGALWAYLQNPNERTGREPSESDLREFKAKWIRATTTEQPQKSLSADQTKG